MVRPRPLLSALMATSLLSALHTKAQQDPMYSMYMWNMMTVNPGYAGSADLLNATALVRRQWVGFAGAPATNTIMAHSPLRRKSIGIGFSVIDDRIGPSHSTGIYADVAYRIKVTKGSRLAFGLKAGATSLRMNMSSVPGTDTNDPVYAADLGGTWKPNFGFGLYYWSRKGYVGISTPKLLHGLFVSASEDGDIRLLKEVSHFFVIGGYVFKLGEDVRFRPSCLLKVVNGAPLNGDISANFLFKERFWVGAAYRTAKEVSAIISYQVNHQLRAGYAYDMGLSALQRQHSGSHEVMLTYDFTFTKRLLRSPRYF